MAGSALAATQPSNPSSACSSSLAGATGGGRAGKPMHSRILRTTTGSVTVAMILKRLAHLGHSKTSAAKTRLSNSAHDSLGGRGGRFSAGRGVDA